MVCLLAMRSIPKVSQGASFLLAGFLVVCEIWEVSIPAVIAASTQKSTSCVATVIPRNTNDIFFLYQKLYHTTPSLYPFGIMVRSVLQVYKNYRSPYSLVSPLPFHLCNQILVVSSPVWGIWSGFCVSDRTLLGTPIFLLLLLYLQWNSVTL